MLCYKDKTFCASKVTKHTCGCELSEEDKKNAEKMELPIAWSNFCDEPLTSQKKV